MNRLLRFLWAEFREYIVLVLLLLISLQLISVSDRPGARNFRSFIFGGFAAVSSVFSGSLFSGGLKEENRELRRRTAELMLEVNLLREYAITNAELKAQLGFRDSSSFSLLPARVLARTFSGSQGNMSINAGSGSGIEVGMPVITHAGLVGIVHTVSPGFALVKTLRNSSLKIIVKNQPKRYQGILKWDGDNLLVTNLPKTAEVEVGDRITTSEMSSMVTIPVPVGLVSRIINPKEGMFNDIVVKPLADPDKVDFVFVVKSALPVRDPAFNIYLHGGGAEK